MRQRLLRLKRIPLIAREVRFLVNKRAFIRRLAPFKRRPLSICRFAPPVQPVDFLDVFVIRRPVRLARARIFAAEPLLRFAAELTAAQRTRRIIAFEHIVLLAGVLHILAQVFIMLRERLDALRHIIGGIALALDIGSKRRQIGARPIQRREFALDGGQAFGARLKFVGDAPLQCPPFRRQPFFLARDSLDKI